MSPSADKWIRPLGRNPQARLRMFCLPFAGGGTAAYRPWARTLPQDVESYAVCLPGREDRIRETPFNRMEPLIAALAEMLLPFLDRPFVLYGHSLGAMIGFELAHVLIRACGKEPARLVFSGRGAPDGPSAPPIAHLADGPFITALNQRYGGIPQALLDEPELLALFVPVLRADLSLLENYTYKPREPLPCALTAVGGSNDPVVPAAAITAWQRHTRGPFASYFLEGEHFFIQTNQARWVALLSSELRIVS